MHASSTNIGAYLKTVGASAAIQGVEPAAKSAGTSYGAAFSIEEAKSCVLTGATGAATGTPDSYTVTYSLQVSADEAFTVPVDVTSSSVALTADSKAGEVDVNLAALASGYFYARVKTVVALTGGTTPTALCAASVTLGGFQNLPV
ncbi:hypothetical protein [Hyalangium sp.]|uniref:hypothetical protein n=1 Tax=Hyalangium sp. TaxID=2028555 RepID=UPI002D731594|nr:hypothetical protein [Hyalangium sp.]HYI01367.1 hypothetical protein [Hyalangium sp.]